MVRPVLSDDWAPGASTSVPPAVPTVLAFPATVTALERSPRAALEATTKVPLATVTAPVKVLVPDSVVVPKPLCVKDPVPVMPLERAKSLLRLIVRAPPESVTAPEPREPVVPPAPTCSVPPEIVVPKL